VLKAVAITNGFIGSGMVILVDKNDKTIRVFSTGITIETAKLQAAEYNTKKTTQS
jgi:hypothetical protein